MDAVTPQDAGEVEFRVLGAVQLHVAGDVVPLRGKHRSLLSVLLLQTNEVVSIDRLAEAMWGFPLPGNASGRVRTLVSELRRAWGAGGSPIVTEPPGYRLRLTAGQLDLDNFATAMERARQAFAGSQPQAAVTHFDEALAWWRGAPLGGASGPFIEAHTARLAELRLRAVEERAEAMLAAGWHVEVIAELDRLLAEQPLRERPYGHLMTALYRDGRRGEALEVYRRLRARLSEELGLEPTSQLQRLHRQVLTDDPALVGARPPAAEPASPVTAPIAPRASAFVGRTGELSQLDALAAEHERLVLVVGPAGVGKTTLVANWARRAASRFPDGQLFVDMRGFHIGQQMTPNQALPLLLIALGVAVQQIPVHADGQTALYRSLLAGRRVLISLDNVATAAQVRPLLAAGAGSLVLVTSRDRLSGLVAVDGARRINLDELPDAEAVEVLSRTAGVAHSGDDRATLLELARLCGGLPLALRIAGARLADRPDLGLRRHVDELTADGPMARLSVVGDEGASVRGTFALSYEALPPGPQRMFRLLGAVPAPAGMSPAALAALGGWSAVPVESTIDVLARMHLVKITEQGRVVCHDLLLHFAAELMAEHDPADERSAAVDRLLHFYLHTADRAAVVLIGRSRLRLPRDPLPAGVSPVELVDQARAREWVDVEWPNLVAALDDAALSGRHRMVVQLADAIRDFLQMQASPAQGLQLVRTGLTAAQRAGDLRAQAAMRQSLSYLHWRAADYQAVLDECRTAAALAERAGWQQGRSAALCNSGIALAQLGRTPDAISQLRRALAIDREIGDRTGEAGKLINLAAAHEQIGELAAAAEFCESALPLVRETGQHQACCIALENLARVRREQGHFDAALDALRRALDITRTIGAPREEVAVLTTTGLVHCDTGALDAAASALTRSVELARHTGDIRLEGFAHIGLARVRTRQGLLDHAAESLATALPLVDRITHHRANVETLLARAELCVTAREHQTAREHATRALTVAAESGYALLTARAHSLVAAAGLGLRDLALCVEHCRRALAVQRRTGQRLGQAGTLLVLGQARRQLGDTDVARSYRRQAHAIFQQLGVAPSELPA
ncbi:AfsR/SARP family transcriptional regulator [Micromonospora auratinigra]|uniref:DNA-binding transcriptional activator of the SARP family n=1 Tax=Micromonospora auratinigra TaxID=261654 RepID=A0A1A9A5B2_9ACTN|nr:BTAD domain-containing putative transcriptional regulator [Micromonospora auratinigra]SBT51393.1 DNA-binding transcriptional activator of the SARP family [Micromonospora auratinigra]